MSLLDSRLKAFLEISQIGTVLGASQLLGLTQTAVTQRIRALEKELAVTLFTRSRKGMRLTSEGEALLQYCKGAEELEGAVFSRISGNVEEAEVHLTIAGPTSIMTSRIVQTASVLMTKYSKLHIHLLIDDEANLVDLVRRDRAQLAIVPPAKVPLEMDSKKLAADRYILVGSSKWRGRKLDDIVATERIIDFYESDATTLSYLRQFNLEKYVKKPRLYVNDNGALIEFFLRGVGFGTLEYHTAEPYLNSGKLISLNRGQAMEDPLALVWYPRPQTPKYWVELIRSIK